MERKVKDRDEELRRKVKEDQEEFALRAGAGARRRGRHAAAHVIGLAVSVASQGCRQTGSAWRTR